MHAERAAAMMGVPSAKNSEGAKFRGGGAPAWRAGGRPCGRRRGAPFSQMWTSSGHSESEASDDWMSCAVERRAAGRSGAQFGAIAAGGRAARLQLPLAVGGHLVLLAVLLEDAPLAVALLHLLPLLRLLWLRVAAHVRKRPVLLRELRRVPVGRELLAADRAHHEPVHLAHRERRDARLLRAPRRRVMRPVDDALVLVRRAGLRRRGRAALADREGLGRDGNERLLRQELRRGRSHAHGVV